MTSNKISIPTVLITGCSKGGIGSALAEAFHERGLHVFATARSVSKMSHLEKLPNATLLELDVTCTSSIATAVETVTALTGGQLNYLINNSGAGITLPILDTDLAKAKQLFDVNLWGTVAVTQAFAPLVIAAKGTIANNASLAAVLPAPWLGWFTYIPLRFDLTIYV
jgi:NAD(P)-dependent dehydrogenase (short-subunit alcohol dehydrogenase family)